MGTYDLKSNVLVNGTVGRASKERYVTIENELNEEAKV